MKLPSASDIPPWPEAILSCLEYRLAMANIDKRRYLDCEERAVVFGGTELRLQVHYRQQVAPARMPNTGYLPCTIIVQEGVFSQNGQHRIDTGEV